MIAGVSLRVLQRQVTSRCGLSCSRGVCRSNIKGASSMRLSGKIVLITGASKGIGRALALGCAREGADIILNYHSDRAGAEAGADEIRALGRRALVVRADLARVTQINRMFTQVRKHF